MDKYPGPFGEMKNYAFSGILFSFIRSSVLMIIYHNFSVCHILHGLYITILIFLLSSAPAFWHSGHCSLSCQSDIRSLGTETADPLSLPKRHICRTH